ncbi:tetraacyldisaccharide 4'-kinase [Ferruginibacter lapsinanis]|uniref:tetraacyldisaccharide 4'-kinase n=1 Tax=Ferruginibacter lapsinanis TaxID=563172 RepID=UPI001E420293|nr:tetraacyldisaccharide 4'-kinase [Ferruginibacter lapsinanis]UEG49426.1 tetraacyldisaccharide 4'-kinase [Ferruginibacter lapsinanis]
MLKSFRYLFLPFSFLYGGIVWIRNWLFDKNYLKSAAINFPVICVGNLAVGGTGKTPMVEYLIRILKNQYKIATLSRGYKRKTKGYGLADENTTALEIGDEPMQFHQKFPGVAVAVGEERLVAIPNILHDKPDTQVIILDDAFQHRVVRAGLNILLTDYNNLYTRDFPLPAGDLRDIKKSAIRADIIVVTKCKHKLSEDESEMIKKELAPADHQKVFFTEIMYANPYHLFSKKEIEITNDTAVLLVCGIANPKPLKSYLTTHVHTYDMLHYADHHIFKIDDLEDIQKQFGKVSSDKKIIITTEKDAVRLLKFENELKDFPVYVLPIEHHFMFNEGEQFNKMIINFIRSFDK